MLAEQQKKSRILRQYELLDLIRAYNPNINEDLVNRAYVYATKMHGSQLRASGDPYFAHPVEVAGILTQLKMDEAAIVTGLLHDTIEDTEATFNEISELFGEEVATLVHGVTKLTQLEVTAERTKQAENLQKFVLALSKDIRVLLVKLADRLHNMRTLHFIKKPEKRQRIARETIDIYAPLARRIGVNKFASELEDLAFRHLHPDAYEAIYEQLETNRIKYAQSTEDVVSKINLLLSESDMHADVSGREKRPFSIWKKLDKKSVSFNEISDIYGFRIIVDTMLECYKALALVHTRWRYVPGRFKDYISVPKTNGYQSLHTSIVTSSGMRLEIQIRTEEMDKIAELGVAAHWKYKNHSYGYHPDENSPADPIEALRNIFSILEDGGDPEDFFENAKLEMFQDQVFVFTPKGDLHALPRGATSVDFAYAVHTGIGDTIVGAKINGINVPLRTPLRSGDIVEILRSDVRKPPPNWESLAITGKARSGIRRLVREFERQEFSTLGKKLAGHALRRLGLNPEDIDLKVACEKLKFKNIEELHEALGRGKLTGTALAEAAVPGFVRKNALGEARISIDNEHGSNFLKGDGLTDGVAIHFMECCSPLPGERIVGIQKGEKGIEVHTIDCDKLADYEDNEELWIDLSWNEEARKNGLAVGRLRLTCENTKGVFADVGKIIANCDGNITNLRAENRKEDFIDLLVDIEVADNKHLNVIAASLRSLPSLIEVERLRSQD
ncbi:RelA/SpoT family protein [Pseudaquidulcibacter saccharophilus]|uniref:RelA/SpoT family protein n=1 Tax=Pseudaquidulcibacter saccharophilus TaxID=2831900 RepID=UPI001EFF4357|nr:bifunctional (p)ppGpp synthetase/guanosine-3',5'-bis(diphosphate) 3'-pyrophosphohydrolase [Pseudaquidulcibacter saccharophilus]